MMELSDYRTDHIGVREFPPFMRITLERNARRELFSQVMRRVGKIKKEYETTEDVYSALYGEKKGKILNLLSEKPHTAAQLIEKSGLSPSAVYHFLSFLRKQKTVSKKGRTYYMEERDSNYLSINEIVKVEEDPLLRRKYGISIKELELSYFLWNRFLEVSPGEGGGYARTYQSEYTLADAIHRWRTGRTDIPVWALDRLAELAKSHTLNEPGSVFQYHMPPGIPVHPVYEGVYKLPVRVNLDLDKIVIQLLQKMSRNHLYTFPKKRKWLFEQLHNSFGEFDDSTSRIPSAIVEVLKSCYGVRLNRSSACIPPRIKSRLHDINPLLRIEEESSLLLHIISLSSRSNGGFEITSRSRSFLQDVSHLTSDLGLGTLTVRKKHSRPHFRAYLSVSKVDVLKRYAHLFGEYPDLEIWLRIPLNQVAEKLVQTAVDAASIEQVCREELSRFVESILQSIERKRGHSYGKSSYLTYKEEITDYFWKEKLIPSPRRVEELVNMRTSEEEMLSYL